MGNTSDPKFVRLAPGRDRGMIMDFTFGSTFGLSGKDVKAFPENNSKAKRFVRKGLSEGWIVPAGRAEYDEARAGDEPLPPVAEIPHQEHKVRDGYLGAQALSEEAAPADDEDEDDEPEADAEGSDSKSGDDEGGTGDTPEPKRPKKSAGKKKAAKGK